MALVLGTAARNAAANAVTALLNGGNIQFLTAGDVQIASVGLANPAFAGADNGQAAANTLTADTNTAAGTVTKFAARNSSNVSIFTGTVVATGGTGDIVLSSTSFGAGDTLSLTSLTYTQPA